MNETETVAGISRLVMAIGNTHIRCAVCVDGCLTDKTVIETERVVAAADSLEPMLDLLDRAGCSRVVISSVVPEVLGIVRDQLNAHSDAPAIVVGDDVPLPISLDVERPEQVGADRACAAAAGYTRAKQACVVVDFGTAITVNVVSDEGVFLGGAILPGVGLGARALAEHTDALPPVRVREPDSPLGRTTEQAMLSGLFFGARGAVRELVESLATAFGKWPYLIFTGGDAALIGQECGFADVVAPDLGLLGLELADRMALEANR